VTLLPLGPPAAGGPVTEWLQSLALVLAVALGAVALVAALAGYPRRRRVRRLAGASRRIAAGELAHAVESGSAGDLGDVEVELERIRALLLEREREAAGLRAETAAARSRLAEAERASDAKTRFIGNVSHEFRTPLSSIIGFTSLLAAEHARLPDTQRAEYLEIVLRNARHLLHVINDILNLSKVEAGTLEVSPAPVYVPEAVSAVVASLGPMAEERGIRVRTLDRSRHFAVADTGRLRQVLQNLLENAIKYSPHGSTVEVEVGSAAEGVRIDVRDQGPGISAADRPRLFKEFSRIPQPGLRVAGAGLGLALSKQLVELMGGSIGVESGPGPGSDFWVLLPAGEEIASDDDAAPHPSGPAQRARGGTVAVVDDDPDIRSFVAAILEGVGYTVVPDDGRQGASDRLCEHQPRPEVVLLDLHLEGRGGFEALDELRACEPLDGVPVIAFTASGTPADLARIRAASFDGHLIKPVEPDTLVRCIDSALATAHEKRSRRPGSHVPSTERSLPSSPPAAPGAWTRGVGRQPDEVAARAPGVSPEPDEPDASGVGSDLGEDDEEDYLAPLRARFREGLGGRLAAMEGALAAGDTDALQREVHKLRGAAAGYGFERLSAAAGVAEEAMRAGAGAGHRSVGELLTLLRVEVMAAEGG
jgi:signal transduction histidine kinase/CheY-like chemotaxis protein/HPt (histidine-containing phosphotransfer) domain-containing protein